MEEVWKDVAGYEGIYQVSNLGAVRAVERVVRYGRKLNGKGISCFLTKDGYLAVHLSRDGNARQHRIHRLVATAFLENPENMPQINHIDEDRTNNRVDNLEWCSVKYNINYGERNKRVSSALSGERSHTHKLTEKQVESIRSMREYKSRKELAQAFGVSASQIGRILSRKQWK